MYVLVHVHIVPTCLYVCTLIPVHPTATYIYAHRNIEHRGIHIYLPTCMCLYPHAYIHWGGRVRKRQASPFPNLNDHMYAHVYICHPVAMPCRSNVRPYALVRSNQPCRS
ncbi:hypothetical protein GGS23DRAFT_559263 [Durotheca rogersii]|uniref:uncharacterized protein n=1 Tax=Durotheca rogersii TaxID=419775 RepID=UPI00221EE439|nr:uncharacterized protein GGS23DRAFT_559263 [Durotheca rogersii]KAI5865448.1 hypothetical protein GGS23DRAFT_559263 [Durotheca rogersii]